MHNRTQQWKNRYWYKNATSWPNDAKKSLKYTSHVQVKTHAQRKPVPRYKLNNPNNVPHKCPKCVTGVQRKFAQKSFSSHKKRVKNKIPCCCYFCKKVLEICWLCLNWYALKTLGRDPMVIPKWPSPSIIRILSFFDKTQLTIVSIPVRQAYSFYY